ncbi:hypothetical protein ACFQH6_09585 [Halobacteriaceae archaeon GCM10025711]
MTDRSVSSNRRKYLKYAGSAMLVGLAGCTGGNGGESETTTTTTTTTESGGGGADEPNHDVPHPGDDTVPDAEVNAETLGAGARPSSGQQEKDNPNVAFQHVPSGDSYCGSCSLYVPDQDGDGFGACSSVKGKIHPCDFCILYTEYDGDPVSCSQV